MLKYFLFMSLSITIISCDVRRKDKVVDDASKQIEQAMKQSTTVEMIDTAYNFGKITEGEKVEYNFRFKNTGTHPLVVTKTTASCGCTVPEKPEKPIMPGEINYIKVVFNSKGKSGHNEKTITVASNANPPFPELILRGDIEIKN